MSEPCSPQGLWCWRALQRATWRAPPPAARPARGRVRPRGRAGGWATAPILQEQCRARQFHCGVGLSVSVLCSKGRRQGQQTEYTTRLQWVRRQAVEKECCWSPSSNKKSHAPDVGTAATAPVGVRVGPAVGPEVGPADGTLVGPFVGTAVGPAAGTAVGATVGAPVGESVGTPAAMGASVGAPVGGSVGTPAVGAAVVGAALACRHT